ATAYLPVRKQLSVDSAVDEYRAHAITWQTLSDLDSLFPNALCTRMMRSKRDPGKLLPAGLMADEDREEYFCGDYFCRRILVPYTDGGEGISEADLFEGQGWKVSPDVVSALSEPDTWRNNLKDATCNGSPGVQPIR